MKRTYLEGVFRADNRKVFIEFDQIETIGNFDKDSFRYKELGFEHLRVKESEDVEMVHTG